MCLTLLYLPHAPRNTFVTAGWFCNWWQNWGSEALTPSTCRRNGSEGGSPSPPSPRRIEYDSKGARDTRISVARATHAGFRILLFLILMFLSVVLSLSLQSSLCLSCLCRYLVPVFIYYITLNGLSLLFYKSIYFLAANLNSYLTLPCLVSYHGSSSPPPPPSPFLSRIQVMVMWLSCKLEEEQVVDSAKL